MFNNFWKNWKGKILDWFFPRRCVGCRQRGTFLCSVCENQIPFRPDWDEAGSSIRSIVPYRHPLVRPLVGWLKYRGTTEVAEIFARWLVNNLLEELADELIYTGNENFLIIPAPLSDQRLCQRGFNQAELIARAFSSIDPSRFEISTGAVKKIKDTPAQVAVKNRHDRLNNLRHAFTVTDPKIITNRTIILLDDVYTTGTTLREIEKVVARAHPRHIIKIAIAHR